MKSKVKEYLGLYEEYESLSNRNQVITETIRKLESEISDLEHNKTQVDFTNTAVMADSMEAYVKRDLEEKSVLFQQKANEVTARLRNATNGRTAGSNKIIERLGKFNADKIAYSQAIDVSKDIDTGTIGDTSSFEKISSLDELLSKIFRFRFLKWPPLFRVILALFIWPMIFMYLTERVAHSTSSTMGTLGLMGLPYIILIANIVVFLIANSSARQWVANNHAVYRAKDDPNRFCNDLYEALLNDYKTNQTDIWMKQIDYIRKNGVTRDIENDPDSIYNIIRNNLSSRYSEFSDAAENDRKEISALTNEKEDNTARIEALTPDLVSMASEVETLISDSDYNEGVLSPLVMAGFSEADKNNVRKPVSIMHDGKPVIICYSDQTHKDGEKFRKAAAELVEKLMMGFYYENYYGNISMNLVDFEGLYFPESRTKGMMNVIRSREDLSKLFEDIKAARRVADSQADGKLSTINPLRLRNRENPMKYNVVYFVGNDFSTVDIETNQLFIGGESFGFVPVIFMKTEDVKAMLEDKNSNKNFTSVIRMINNAEQIYSMEGILSAIS